MDSIFMVTAAAAETSLLTVAELREAAGVEDGSQDATLLRMGRRASAALARACNIVTDGIHVATLLSETCEEKIRCVSGCSVRLGRRPVTEVASVTVGGSVVDAANFELNAAAGAVTYAPGGTPQGWRTGATVISYKGGFVAVPDDLKEAMMRLIAGFRSDTGRDPNLKREDIPGVLEREYWVAPSSDDLLSQEINDLIAPYVRRWL